MSASLVGSEMCIRDSGRSAAQGAPETGGRSSARRGPGTRDRSAARRAPCLLYTSDAADDM
eukprot:886136-Alexandrium_andersonii.AAC.1